MTDLHKYMNEDKRNYGAHSSLVVGSYTKFCDDQSETSASDPFFLSVVEQEASRSALRHFSSNVHTLHEQTESFLNRGRTTKLTNDTERGPVLAPSAYRDRFLKSKSDDILKKTPQPKSYKLDETNIIVSRNRTW